MRRSLGDKRKYVTDTYIAEVTRLYDEAIELAPPGRGAGAALGQGHGGRCESCRNGTEDHRNAQPVVMGLAESAAWQAEQGRKDTQ